MWWPCATSFLPLWHDDDHDDDDDDDHDDDDDDHDDDEYRIIYVTMKIKSK
jgi:hypothetical protein